MNKDITLEDLGYKKAVEDNNMLVYDIKHFNSDTDRIVFYKELKVFEIYRQSDIPFEYPIPQTINMQELKAINKQCEELGWLDEKRRD